MRCVARGRYTFRLRVSAGQPGRYGVQLQVDDADVTADPSFFELEGAGWQGSGWTDVVIASGIDLAGSVGSTARTQAIAWGPFCMGMKPLWSNSLHI